MPATVAPISDKVMTNLHILKRWLGENLSPAGPFAETDDATLRALSQSLEGTLRDEILKELDRRAQNGAR